MASQRSYTSPFASQFKSAIRRGTPASVAVENIASRQGTTMNQVFQSLFKVGLVFRQKMNGQWIYWPVEGVKAKSTITRTAQWKLWQSFVDWAVASGYATPEQICSGKGSQQEFIQSLRKFFNKQFSSTTSGSSSRRTSTSTSTSTSTGRTLRYHPSRTRRIRRAA